MRVRHILVPLDGSWLSDQALPYAEDLARLYGCKLTLLRARSVPMALWQDGSIALPPDDVEMEQTLSYLESHAEKLRVKGLTVEVTSPLGDPAEVVLEFASSHQVDLIVMTSHGLTGFKRWLYGSVAERVVRHAACPTLVVGMQTLQHIQKQAQGGTVTSS